MFAFLVRPEAPGHQHVVLRFNHKVVPAEESCALPIVGPDLEIDLVLSSLVLCEVKLALRQVVFSRLLSQLFGSPLLRKAFYLGLVLAMPFALL